MAGLGVGVGVGLLGCQPASPWEQDLAAERERLRQSILTDARQQVGTAADDAGTAGPTSRSEDSSPPRGTAASSPAPASAAPIELTRGRSEVEERLSQDRLDELNRISGAGAYEQVQVEPGMDLTGSEAIEAVELSLDEAVELAVANNLDLSVARLSPKIARQQLIQAQAAFDWTLFADADWQKLDTPQPQGTVPGLANDTQQDILTLATGVRKLTRSGARVELSTALARNERVPSFFAVNRFYDADVQVAIDQPLLRGFGSEVNEAEIVLAQNAAASARADVRQALDTLARDVEAAYWDLVFARRGLLIQQRLLDRTVVLRDRLEKRAEFDVNPIRITEASSRVELRRSDLIRLRAQVRTASDRLKRLLNAEQLPLTDETLIRPADDPADSPLTMSLIDSVLTALDERPELERALLSISDSSVRRRLADNALLPRLDLTAALGFNGIDPDNGGDAYADLAEGNYIDYLLGVAFEQPIGNRAAEALDRQRQLEYRQATLIYRQTAQDVVLEVKNALRDVLTSYELVGATRAARWAAADSLRSINVQEDVGVALTEEFLLDLKLNAQERLADAETQEARALSDYQTAIAELYRATGTLAERYGVVVEASR
jgi:outer membrane protein TolC